MLWFLVGTGALYALIGQLAESLTLLASILPLIAMDAVLHRRTQASTQGLRSRLASRALVVRAGATVEIPVEGVVPGDLAVIRAGSPFPADGIVIAGDELQADESALSGEAYPVRKRPFDDAETLDSSDGRTRAVDTEHWGHAGTRLLTGTATLRVLLTGGETLYGEIVRSARSGTRAPTPLQRAVGSLVRVLLAAAAVLCVILAAVRLRQGFGWVDALVSAVTLAVAALPEEFPVVFVMFLGVGVYRLARRKALVRRSVSVENIGRVTCICSDKTGTITLGELELTHVLPARESTEARLAELSALASRRESGDPLDEAILRACVERSVRVRPAEVVATFPFTEDRRRETAVVRAEGLGLLAATKGAPELVLSLCSLEVRERTHWEERAHALAAEGHKVIACASRDLAEAAWPGGEPDRGLRFEGLLAFEDPVREDVPDAIAQCREAGIRVVMVTGDHRTTATAVAREIGLDGDEASAVAGDALDALLRAKDPERLARLVLVARALPAQKLALVQALQAAGEIVAVTGDGVNDVPALQVADISIAMGERATRSAREVAAIVLLDDCFTTIVSAIAEGRQLFRNLQLSFRYLLTIHIPLVVTAALIPLAGYPLLYLPIHIVWLELVIHPSALLAFQDLPAPGRLADTRQRSRQGFFSRREWAGIALVGTLLTALVSFGYDWSLGAAGDVEHGRAMALVVLSVASAGVTAALSGLRTHASRWIVAGTLAFTAALVQIAPLAARLHLRPLHLDEWGIAIGGGALTCLPLLIGALAGRRPTPGRKGRQAAFSTSDKAPK
jgi:Ca2+-transporting ATPase